MSMSLVDSVNLAVRVLERLKAGWRVVWELNKWEMLGLNRPFQHLLGPRMIDIVEVCYKALCLQAVVVQIAQMLGLH